MVQNTPNALSGSIPKELGALSELKTLKLGANGLTGARCGLQG